MKLQLPPVESVAQGLTPHGVSGLKYQSIVGFQIPIQSTLHRGGLKSKVEQINLIDLRSTAPMGEWKTSKDTR